MHRTWTCSALALISLALASCGAPQTPAPPESPGTLMEAAVRVPVARIEVTPASSLLTAAGQTTTLKATLYDAQDRVVSGTVKWVSSNAAAVEVSTKGVAKARVAVGSSMITAEVGGVKSKPVLVTVARLDPNAVVVTDAQISSGAAVLAPGPDGAPVGTQFTVTLNGVTPKAGQVLLSSGQSPISGRVLSSVPSGKQTVVTLQTVPLGALYQDLSVSQHSQVSASDLVPLTGAQAPERVERHPDGSVTVSYRLPKGGPATAGRLSAQSLPGDGTLPGPFSKTEFEVGPFKCTSTLDVLLSGNLLNLKIQSKLDVDVFAQVEGGELKTLNMMAAGDITGTVTGGLDLDLGAQGALKCKAVFARLPVPISGPLAPIVAPSIPIGLGFVLDGKLKLGRAQFAVEGKVTSKVNVGFAYDVVTGEVRPVKEVYSDSTLSPKLKLPSLMEDLRLEGGLTVQVVSGVDVVAFPWLGPAAQALELLEVTAGTRLEGNLAPISTQARTDTYASSYALKSVVTVGPGSTLQNLFGLMRTRNQVKLFNAAVLLDVIQARSPNGAMGGDAALKVYQLGHINVDLNPANVDFIEGGYNVDQVVLYRDRDGVLEPVRSEPATDGQTHFEFPYMPVAGEAGQTLVFRAFVVTRLGLIPVEVNDDAKFTVTVSPDDGSSAPTPPTTPPSTPPYDGTGPWTGTVLTQWSGNEASGASGGTVSSTHTASGEASCTLGDVGADGTQTASWSLKVDERTETIDTNNYQHITTRTANLSRSGLLQDSAHPDDYILTMIKVYHLSNGVLYSMKIEVEPVSPGTVCALYPVDDENPDPKIIQGHRITHDPNPNWTQLYQVDAVLK
ncbi:Ig-like domain-containing protein [Deinococcus navajonensis]|uniref:Ig-like domain-containing protein n=1 Tax=Deinococcus navajonensis TaxID=309884 RepID=A0ABV8XJF0_9DEIO